MNYYYQEYWRNLAEKNAFAVEKKHFIYKILIRIIENEYLPFIELRNFKYNVTCIWTDLLLSYNKLFKKS